MNPRIYVSSACVRTASIGESVRKLARAGFRCIELSGGSEPYDGLIDDLLGLKREYGLEYRIHNYFPPPDAHFILNLASLDDRTYEQSRTLCLRALDACRRLGSDVYGVHAGFLVDISLREVGAHIEPRPIDRIEQRLDRFCDAVQWLSDRSSEVRLYIENNVISERNHAAFGDNPLLLCDVAGYRRLAKRLRFSLLLDLAHLHVSTRTLGGDFEAEAATLLADSDYIHVSGNSGHSDSNETLTKQSSIVSALRRADLRNKTLTLEVYSGLDAVRESYDILHGLTFD